MTEQLVWRDLRAEISITALPLDLGHSAGRWSQHTEVEHKRGNGMINDCLHYIKPQCMLKSYNGYSKIGTPAAGRK